MFIEAHRTFTSKIDDFVEADAFVRPIYKPKDTETEKAVLTVLEQLGLPTDEKHIAALASTVVAAKAASRGEGQIACPGDSGYYTETLYGWRIAKKVRQALVVNGYLEALNKQKRGQSVVYRTNGLDFDGQFQSKEEWPVRVRESKERWENKGQSILKRDCRRRFGPAYRAEENKLETLNRTYEAHPLKALDGTHWGSVFRGFNEGCLDKGGRLYGDWQQLKEIDRLKLMIDGEPVVEIDVVASFLFIVSAKGAFPVVSKDPYADIPWVTDEPTRDLAKRLVSAIISKDGPLMKFPVGLRDEFTIPKKDKLADYRDPILATYPQLDPPAVSGMEAMFLESEAIIGTIEALIAKGIVSFPVHDCLLVAEEHKDTAIEELWKQMDDRFGAKPWLKVSYGGRPGELYDPFSGTKCRKV